MRQDYHTGNTSSDSFHFSTLCCSEFYPKRNGLRAVSENLEEWENYIEDYTKKLAEQAKKQETKREGIVISTLHAVKGLEYDKVYIMNVNEGSIPYKKAVLAESLEEERRLFYVGMTRAKKELMLCYVRRQYDKERDPSRFLEETGLF